VRNRNSRRIIVVITALFLSLAFGAVDQYLGVLPGKVWSWTEGRHDASWLIDVSLLSAPWLLIAFLAGRTQRAPGPAALLGLACTMAAIGGYGLMTLSPVEGAELTRESVAGFVRSQQHFILGGLLTGPLFGWFGYGWRRRRAWGGALVAAAAFCLEPLARELVGMPLPSGYRGVVVAEIAVGLALVAYVVSQRAATRRRSRRPA
jgi:hypothetical protein